MYEYYDYVAHFSGGEAYLNEYTEMGARIKFWQESQSWIMVEIRKLMDQGWEPLTEIGPGGMTLSYKKKYFDWDFFGWVIYLLIGFGSFGILLILWPFFVSHQVAIPQEFKVSMRRRIN
jgi:hypothetical protein